MGADPTSATETGRLGPLAQIAVTVRDLERAIAFYRDTLGLTFLFTAPPAMAFFDLGGVRLLLGEAPEGEAEHRASVLYFRVDAIDAAHRRLVDAGVDFAQAPHKVHEDARHELWLAAFTDPEGNILELLEERPKS